MDPEDLARKAMLAGDTPIMVEPAVEMPVVAAPVPAVAKPAPLDKTGLVDKMSKWCNMANLKTMLNNPIAQYIFVFVLTSLLLIVLSPPFVQVRRKNQLEKAPTSYKRVMIVAGVTTAAVAFVPLCLTHQSKIVSAVEMVKKWF